VANIVGHGSVKKFPRAPYMLGGNISFRLAGKKNGLSKRDMEQKLS